MGRKGEVGKENLERGFVFLVFLVWIQAMFSAEPAPVGSSNAMLGPFVLPRLGLPLPSKLHPTPNQLHN